MSDLESTIAKQTMLQNTPLQAGQEFGGYRVIRKIGAGAMGAVYEVEHLSLCQRFALKTMVIDGAEEAPEEAAQRFYQEARVTAQLRHPGIVQIQTLDTDRETGISYFVMEYVAMTKARRKELLRAAVDPELVTRWFRPLSTAWTGGELQGLSLEDVAQRAKKMKRQINPEVVRGLLIDICDALHYAHTFGAGVLHRDIKPANILIRPDGHAVIADFGVAKVIDRSFRKHVLQQQRQSLSLRVDRDGVAYHLIFGTREYMAPELLSGSPPSVQTDLYALGVTAYQLLTGQQFTAGAEPPSAMGIDPEWDNALHGCLRAEPEQRWQDVAEFRQCLIDLPARIKKRKVKRALTWGGFAAGLIAMAAAGSIAARTVSAEADDSSSVVSSAVQISDEKRASDGGSSYEFPMTRDVDMLTLTRSSSDMVGVDEIASGNSFVLQRVHPDVCGVLDLRHLPLSAIADDAFVECKHLTDVLLPEGLKDVVNVQSRNVFAVEPTLEGAIITGMMTKPLPRLFIPETINGLSVIGIAPGAFKGRKDLEEIHLPKTLRVIGEDAFRDSSIKRVAFAEGLKSIENGAFYNSKLEFALLPKSLQALGDSVFQNSSLKSLKMHDNITEIGERVITGCQFNQKSLHLSASMKKMPKYWGWYTTGIGTFIFPAVTEVSEWGIAQVGASRLTTNRVVFIFQQRNVVFHRNAISGGTPGVVYEFHFPKGSSPKIEAASFYAGTDVSAEIYIGGRLWQVYKKGILGAGDTIQTRDGFLLVKSSYGFALKGFSGEKEMPQHLVIPNSHEGIPIVSIAANAFLDDRRIETVSLPDSIVDIGPGAFKSSSLKSINFNKGITNIQDEAFKGTALQQITLPETLKYLGQSAFQETKLTRIDLPEQLETLGVNCFAGCPIQQTKLRFPEGISVLSPSQLAGYPTINRFFFPGVNHVPTDALKGLGDGLSSEKVVLIFSQPEVVFEEQSFDSNSRYRGQIELHFQYGADFKVDDNAITDVEMDPHFMVPTKWVDYESEWDKEDAETPDVQSDSESVQSKVITPKSSVSVTPRSVTETATETAKPQIKRSSLWEYEELINGAIELTKCRGQKPQIEIPNEIDGKPVYILGENLFKNFTRVSSIVIPDTVTTIKEGCFQNMSALRQITLPRSFVIDLSLNRGMFKGCRALDEVVFKNLTTVLPEDCFVGCTSLRRIVFCRGEKLPSFNFKKGFKDVLDEITLVFEESQTSFKYYKQRSFIDRVPTKTVTSQRTNKSSRVSKTHGLTSSNNLTLVNDAFFVREKDDDELMITASVADKSNIEIPPEFDGKRITYIEKGAFENKVADLWIPEGKDLTIAPSAFSGGVNRMILKSDTVPLFSPTSFGPVLPNICYYDLTTKKFSKIKVLKTANDGVTYLRLSPKTCAVYSCNSISKNLKIPNAVDGVKVVAIVEGALSNKVVSLDLSDVSTDFQWSNEWFRGLKTLEKLTVPKGMEMPISGTLRAKTGNQKLVIVVE